MYLFGIQDNEYEAHTHTIIADHFLDKKIMSMRLYAMVSK